MNGIVKYETDRGEVQLSPEIIKKYLVSGDGSKVTNEEIVLFINLCRYQRLNPFLREAYLIKYSEKYPATIVVGKDVFVRRAAANPNCAGWQAGVIVQDGETLVEREGSLVLDSENLVGGWAKVYRKDWQEPLKISVSLQEYTRENKEGVPQRAWATMKATMIRKVALSQALREAFPEDFQGLYSAEEMGINAEELSPHVGGVVENPETKVENSETKAKNETGKDVWSWFWTSVKAMGFSTKEAHEIAGVTSFSGFTREQLSEVLHKLQERKNPTSPS